MNDRLREAFNASTLDEAAIAKQLGVDPKTVERWVAGRLPYPRYRRALAEILGFDEKAIWHQRITKETTASNERTAEIKVAYAHRWAVPREQWIRLFLSAKQDIGVLAYAALFLAEDDGIIRTLAERARAGVHIRILLGNPKGSQVAERGTGEGIGDAIAAKVRNALTLYRALADIDGVEIRLHDTALYASIYRADNDVLINTHAYGVPASHSPVIGIRHAAAGDMAETYLESFDRVWAKAKAPD
ncbi:DUF5919 domain-containing protein [Actinoallomurus acanthiterrae]